MDSIRKAPEGFDYKSNANSHAKTSKPQKPSGCPCDYGICDECSSQGSFNPRN